MKPAVLEGGVLTIAREALEEAARRKGFDLQLTLSPAGIEASVTVPAGIISIPARVRLDRIRAEGDRLVGENLSVHSALFPIPLSMLASYAAKYPFLALDTAGKRIHFNLNHLLPGYICLNIKDIAIIDDAVQIHLNDLVLEQLPDI
jgi:hypothetical protein